MKPIHPGENGPGVVEIRRILQDLRLVEANASTSRSNDPYTWTYDERCVLAVRQFQQERGLLADGIIDSDTYHELTGALYQIGDRVLSYQDRMLRGDDVRQLQAQLAELGFHRASLDGIFGIATHDSLRAFQSDYGLTVDGRCGPLTVRALRNLLPKVTGGSPSVLASQAYRRTTGPDLAGRYIMIDAAEPSNPVAAGFIRSVARRVREQLELLGANAVSAQDRHEEQSPTQRATRANDVGAEIYVSLDVTHHDSSQAEGVATYYYGSPSGSSEVGRELAGLLQREVTARTTFTDLGEHPRVFEILRLTRMPSVYIELGYLSNPADMARMADPEVQRNVVAAIVAGLQRFYLVSVEDYPTGTWQIPAGLF